MPSARRHLQHIKTEMKQYTRMYSPLIPTSVGYSVANVVPQPQDLVNVHNPSRFLRNISTNPNSYYELTGKQPTDLELGEIAVSYSKGCERLFIKNSDGEIVEFRPYQQPDEELAVIKSIEIPFEKVTVVNNICELVVTYDDITAIGIWPNRPMTVTVIHNNVQRSDVDVLYSGDVDGQGTVGLVLRIPSDVDLIDEYDHVSVVIVGSPFMQLL